MSSYGADNQLHELGDGYIMVEHFRKRKNCYVLPRYVHLRNQEVKFAGRCFQ